MQNAEARRRNIKEIQPSSSYQIVSFGANLGIGELILLSASESRVEFSVNRVHPPKGFQKLRWNVIFWKARNGSILWMEGHKQAE
ncbi:hypothetical protein CDAR_113681 [Caerostris darwini]|uniref:Uncharacterized protein n=1 Tax=Caerostris darwini TaxID=1538125 RepID=A0AAV4PQ69_9ARAC|nr:hypothetical protein CDAR_113681 [Caerostris darwini]